MIFASSNIYIYIYIYIYFVIGGLRTFARSTNSEFSHLWKKNNKQINKKQQENKLHVIVLHRLRFNSFLKMYKTFDNKINRINNSFLTFLFVIISVVRTSVPNTDMHHATPPETPQSSDNPIYDLETSIWPTWPLP
jgi:D-alanyl-lipoteichoic acid acyltransferase DltB (MBOAT superfamily)